MPTTTPNFWSERDGTGQRERLNPALLPEYFLLDGRSMADWVRFARELGGRLRYFDFDNSENGDWSNFLGTDERASVAEILRFMEDPSAFSDQPDKAAWLARPHFVLFLVFLQLLKQEQDAINGFTKRHLDYYYCEVLGLKPKAAEADYAFMLMELVRGVAHHRVEKGTLIQAGKTPNGQPRLFQTTDEIVVNTTKLGAAKVFFQEREYLSFEALLQNPKNVETGHVLKVAVGDPADKFAWPPMALANGVPTDDFFKGSLVTLLQFSSKHLKLSLGELRRFLALKDRIEGAWHRTYFKRINDQLQKIKSFSIANDWDFNTNFKLATVNAESPTGYEAYPVLPAPTHPFRKDFKGDIRHVQDLYERLLDLGYAGRETSLSPELITIEQSLKFRSVHDFMEMMTDFQVVQQDWKRINAWLIKISADKGKLYVNRQTRPNDALLRLNEVSGAIFNATNIGVNNILNVTTYWQKVLEIEQYFQLPAEDVLFLLEKWASASVTPPPRISPAESKRMVALLEKAHQKNTLQREAIQLKNTHTFPNPENSNVLERIFKEMFEETFGMVEQNKEKRLPAFKNEADNRILEALNNALLVNDGEAEQYIREIFFMAPRDYKAVYGVYKNPQRAPAEVDELYQTIVAAQRRKNDQPLFSGEITHKGLYSAPDASVLFSGREGEPFPRWRTFGWKSPHAKDKPAPWQQAAIGFAIQSPLLALSAGIRTITLSIKFHEWSSAVSPISALKESFEYLLSHEKTPEGIAATFKSVESDWDNTDKTAQLKLELNAEQLPVTAPHPDFFAGTLPVLKVCLKQADEKENAKVLNEKNAYAAISTWRIKSIALSVNASGLLPEAAWNDDSEINPKKPFLPFGLHPRVESRFSFLHPEISNKKLASVDLNLVWMNRPGDFTSYYSGYGYNPLKPIQFQAKLNGKTAYDLFPTTEKITATTNLDNPSAGWFLELLSPDFQHDKYTELLSGDVSYETLPPTGNPPKTTIKILARPNPPYTPRLKSFTFGYTSAEETLTEGFFHLLPFGHALPEKGVGNSFPLLPPLPYEAELYLGLEMAAPPQTISLLFQMADGTADPDSEARPLRWQYLAADGWRPRKGDKQEPAFVLADETGGLSRSGIVRLLLPETASSHNPTLPSGMIWLRIAIDHYRHSVCDTIGIHPQAVQVVRVASTDVAEDPGKPLPPNTIGNFVARRSNLKTPSQPYSSFGGRSPESDIDFYVRISERLRHKQRALSIWDIEHLVLQAFPDVYRAKCLPSGWLDDAIPGTVDVIVVPNLRGRLPMDPFKPQFPATRLAEVAAWLQQHGPLPAQYRARNARFVPLRVEAIVQFHQGLDPGYYKQRLSEALTEHLAPWAFDQGADIRFGGNIYPGQLLWFIESQPYVDFVMDLKLYRNNAPESSGQVLTTADPDEVWVSDTHHDIRLYSDRVVPAQPTLRGVGYWAVQIDFKIA